MCVGRLLGMGGDSLLIRLCGNLLEVGSQAKGGRKCVLDWLAGGWWWRESQSLMKGWLEHIFCIPGLRT